MERIINIFFFGDEQSARSIGYCTYHREGPPEDQVQFLREKVEVDYANATQHMLPALVDWYEIPSIVRSGEIWELLDQRGVNAGNDEIYCVTYIVNGRPRFDEIVDEFAPDAFPDYLRFYLTDEGFDFSKLINDDFFDSIKLLWNNHKYISALKLMLSTIDTLGFIEYGPETDCFVRWLDQYCDLGQVGVTSTELWELRNALLHMSNLESRRNRTGQVQKLLPMITHPSVDIPIGGDGYKGFHVGLFLLDVFPRGIGTWLQSYNSDRSKFRSFVSRYDTIVSEGSLYTVLHHHRGGLEWPGAGQDSRSTAPMLDRLAVFRQQ